MMKQDVLFANTLQQIRYLRRKTQASRSKWRKLQVGTRRLLRQRKQARQVHRAIGLEYLPWPQPKLMSQGIDNFGWCAGFDLQPHDIALAAAVQLTVYQIKQVAGLFLV